MSFYRQSPGKRSGYTRSPPRALATERELLEQEIHLKNVYRFQAQNRRLLDEISLLQIKLRKTDELEAKCDSLLKQNSILAQENEHFGRELAERRYEIDRLRSNSVQLQERDTIKTAQLSEMNRSLEIEIDLLKKERLESNKLYEGHIQKLEFMLQDKIKELDLLSLRCNELLADKQAREILFEEEMNKLKNTMNRTSHDLERELEYTKQKQTTEKFVEIETLKKNYASQMTLLDDQISKLKATSSYKSAQFEGQLQENKAIRLRYEQQVRALEGQNTSLREKILKLEELNRSEVVNIELKYNDIQKKGANSLIYEHQQEMKTLLGQIDRASWLLKDKTSEIQTLLREKKEQKECTQERELSFRAEIDTLKNKLQVLQDKRNEETHELSKKVNTLSDKLLAESENHEQRVNTFKESIYALENEIKFKQGENDHNKAVHALKIKQLQRNLEQATNTLDSVRRQLTDCKQERAKETRNHQQFKAKAEKKQLQLNKKVNELEVQHHELFQKSERHISDSGNEGELLRAQIESLNKTVAVLQGSLSKEQKNHSKQMEALSNNLRIKIEQLQKAQKKVLQDLQKTHVNELGVLQLRIAKLQSEKQRMQNSLSDYVKMYDQLQKFFVKPHEGAVSEQQSSNCIYEVLSQVSQSTIHIF